MVPGSEGMNLCPERPDIALSPVDQIQKPRHSLATLGQECNIGTAGFDWPILNVLKLSNQHPIWETHSVTVFINPRPGVGFAFQGPDSLKVSLVSKEVMGGPAAAVSVIYVVFSQRCPVLPKRV